ncbi:hypothetical protein AD006_28960 (plasmid) [Pseudonocardia sp. EC080610-09]|uniref:hypothetical protein n=1 Tax=Pseudonocardia sp. EC080610-09 TaxID=1688404 RepID=UPI000706B2DC|nr:hypothetical protein [Pseudonocardia sp. EC080610-09]ALL79332.1 hypothetical protein AD006_28960 [Pseudonocardia sp. EC080610-09]ALL85303.1 hypothetical protein AD017_29350 [Pseudonocardia sp. EC080619-01]
MVFDGGDWITLGIGLLAAALATLTWIASRRSATAAAESAAEAAKANEEARTANKIAAEQLALGKERAAQEQAEAAERAADQARLIQMDVANFGGIQVRILNHSTLAITHVRLTSVVGTAHPDWTWRLNRAVMGNRLVRPSVAPGKNAKFFLDFADPAGGEHHSAGEEYEITYRFTDAQGVRWQRTGSGSPQQVDRDDTDLDE